MVVLQSQPGFLYKKIWRVFFCFSKSALSEPCSLRPARSSGGFMTPPLGAISPTVVARSRVAAPCGSCGNSVRSSPDHWHERFWYFLLFFGLGVNWSTAASEQCGNRSLPDGRKNSCC